MFDTSSLKLLLTEPSLTEKLKKGSEDKYAVRLLQGTLYLLGFGQLLSWEKYQADGDYGSGTTRAVKAFCDQNGIDSDGTNVTPEIAQMLLQRYEMLDDMALLKDSVDQHTTATVFTETGSGVAVRALQKILNMLGYGQQLEWDKYGAYGDYNQPTVDALTAYSQKVGIRSDGKSLNAELGQKMLSDAVTHFGEEWDSATFSLEDASKETLTQTTSGRHTTISDGWVKARFQHVQKGLAYAGQESPQDFVEANIHVLLGKGLTQSAINVMLPVSANEGKLDAVNTWDSAFLSFGMFQWTAGPVNRNAPGQTYKGELQALLKKVKAEDPNTFQLYYGQYGLDVVDAETNLIDGKFSLNGKTLETVADKEQLRTPVWAFRFWRSGLDPLVQLMELTHAYSRIYRFYHHSHFKILKKFYVDELITSEYGVALLLDNHVNLPYGMKYHLEKGLQNSGLADSDPSNWTTEQENLLISKYLESRANPHEKYRMTHPEIRAERTKDFLENGTVSNERGSFEHQPKTRSTQRDTGDIFPPGHTQDDHTAFLASDVHPDHQ